MHQTPPCRQITTLLGGQPKLNRLPSLIAGRRVSMPGQGASAAPPSPATPPRGDEGGACVVACTGLTARYQPPAKKDRFSWPTRWLCTCKRAPHDVYIGRPSKWGNPFVIGRDGPRTQVIERYERWLLEQHELLAALPELAGKTLGCWCAPHACHGDVLARLANAPR
jgi:hypothetical protein